jgi:hypothetical protein
LRIAKAICDQIALGKPLSKALEIVGPLAPNKFTLWKWLDDHPEFRELYERARALQADAHADRMLELAEDCLEKPSKAAAIKVACDIMKWQAEIRNPRTYGTKVQHELKAPPMKPEDLKREIAALEAELGVKAQAGMDTAKRHTPAEEVKADETESKVVNNIFELPVADKTGWTQ